MIKLVALVCLVGLAAAGPPVSRSRQEIDDFRTFLESTRGDGSSLENRMASNPLANAWENSGKYEGDIVLDEEQIAALVDDFASSRSAYIFPNTKWPDNIVVWEFGAGEFTATQELAINNSIADIERNSCIRFRYTTPADQNFVRLTNRPDGCYASIGYWATRGVHTLNLANICFIPVIIVHEWLHIIGFLHMHSTYTRDDYIRIVWENIESGWEHNFNKFENNLVSNLELPYEYTSCMHYGPHAFSSNGLPTIEPLRPFDGLMGQRQNVTDLDWLRLNRHYECPGAWNKDAQDASA
ncbi:hatching enzyme 1.2-like [Achroia grisella]|uniref:hatching enzyme 1.2-like n=1 Tax=Achroia grisella TaxID=688607 RepID=UPI0027D2B919|nr:hatching enzyme 1.2-like [Achroia grisella]